MTVKFNDEHKRYEIDCPTLDADFVRVTPDGRHVKSGLSAYMTRHQNFRVIPKQAEVVYAHGRFYEPRVDLAGHSSEDGKLNLHRIFHADSKLGSAKSEKGKECREDGVGWQHGCLFDLIDRAGRGNSSLDRALRGREWLICDDMDRESADFIAVWSDRIAYIHAKAFGETKQRSASAFHEICSQAIKNLDYLSPYAQPDPRRVTRWQREWKAPLVERSVRRRIRRSGARGTVAKQAEAFMEAHMRVVTDPSARREVWMVLGSGFSLEAFNQERSQTVLRPEIVQIAYLLQATWAATSEIGATLRLFCSP